ncbi:MAG: hypothetical protein U5R48_15125 [Gammaproteobacteria bacterium]|nr:hypothetical protein [Gammaproteobacteria bacterium]
MVVQRDRATARRSSIVVQIADIAEMKRESSREQMEKLRVTTTPSPTWPTGVCSTTGWSRQ